MKRVAEENNILELYVTVIGSQNVTSIVLSWKRIIERLKIKPFLSDKPIVGVNVLD